MLAAPMFVGILVLFVLHLLLTRVGAHADLLYVALQLTLALALVRLGTYGMRLMLGRQTWFDAWEGRIAVAIWAVIALELVGWLGKIQATLEHVHLIPGRNVFTLWELVKGIVVVTVFVFVTTLLARTVERRVMRLGSSRPVDAHRDLKVYVFRTARDRHPAGHQRRRRGCHHAQRAHRRHRHRSGLRPADHRR